MTAEACLGHPGGLKEPIVYDECDDPAFERALRDGFKPASQKRSCGGRLIRDIKRSRSKSEPGIQLADMLCGATGKFIDGQGDYFDLIRKKVLAIEVLKEEKVARETGAIRRSPWQPCG